MRPDTCLCPDGQIAPTCATSLLSEGDVHVYRHDYQQIAGKSFRRETDHRRFESRPAAARPHFRLTPAFQRTPRISVQPEISVPLNISAVDSVGLSLY